MKKNKFSKVIKFNATHDSLGRFGIGNHTETLNMSGLRIRHASRFSSVEETLGVTRTDLGHFKDRSPRSMLSNEAIKASDLWMAHEKAMADALPEDQKNTLHEYTGANLYRKLNRAMVEGRTIDKELHQHAVNLSEAIKKSELPEDITLFRGMNARGVLSDGDKAVGMVFSDKVFKSTSLVQDNALAFASGKDRPCLMRIKAKKGQHGLFADGLLSQNPHEMECVLHPGQKFIITGHSEMEVSMGRAKTKVRVYDMEML